MKKTLLALAVSLAAVSGAHASWDTGMNPSNVSVGNGEALFEAFDDIAGVSYVKDLGVRYDDFVSGAAFNGQQINVDLSVFAGSAAGNVSWQIVAGSGDKRNGSGSTAGTNNFSKYGFLTTVDAAVTSFANFHSTTTVNNVLSNLNQVSAVTSDVFGPASENNSYTESSAFGPKFVGLTMTGLTGTTFGLDTYGDIAGETMSMLRVGFGATSSAKQSNILGSINLTGSTLTIGSAPVAQTPVPAAIWLLGSALAGLGGIARRRNQA